MKILKKDGNEISGTIEDNLYGSATFKGTISPEQIKFEKKYINPKGAAARNPIFYEGKKVKDYYEGLWEFESSFSEGAEKRDGTFRLEKYIDSPTLDIIATELQKQNSSKI
jgi:hypothetical protein